MVRPPGEGRPRRTGDLWPVCVIIYGRFWGFTEGPAALQRQTALHLSERRQFVSLGGAPQQMRQTTLCLAEISARRGNGGAHGSLQSRCGDIKVSLTARGHANSHRGSAARLSVADRHEVTHDH